MLYNSTIQSRPACSHKPTAKPALASQCCSFQLVDIFFSQ